MRRRAAPRTSSEITSFVPKRAAPSRTVLAGAAGGVVVLLAVFALGGGSESPSSAPVSRPPPREPPLVELGSAAAQAPIVIEATPETVEAPVPGIEQTDPGIGTLVLSSEPDVVVFEGNRRLGRTPLEVKLSAGRHDLKLVNRAKHLEEKRRVDIRANQVHKRELSFGVGALKVDAPDGTKVFLNSRYLGASPLAKIVLAEGRHHVELKKGSERDSRWIEVPASHTVDYRVRFPD